MNGRNSGLAASGFGTLVSESCGWLRGRLAAGNNAWRGADVAVGDKVECRTCGAAWHGELDTKSGEEVRSGANGREHSFEREASGVNARVSPFGRVGVNTDAQTFL